MSRRRTAPQDLKVQQPAKDASTLDPSDVLGPDWNQADFCVDIGKPTYQETKFSLVLDKLSGVDYQELLFRLEAKDAQFRRDLKLQPEDKKGAPPAPSLLSRLGDAISFKKQKPPETPQEVIAEKKKHGIADPGKPQLYSPYDYEKWTDGTPGREILFTSLFDQARSALEYIHGVTITYGAVERMGMNS